MHDGLPEYLASRAKEVGIVTFAIEPKYHPEKHLKDVTKLLEAQGANARHVASEGELDSVDALFLMGGHPDTLIAELAAADMIQPIYDKWIDGMTLGGDSAGVMVLFEEMMAPRARMEGNTDLVPALGFVRGAVAAVHWNTADEEWKKRFREANEPKGIIAIDEDTSLIWEDGKESAIGLGKVQKFGPVSIEL